MCARKAGLAMSSAYSNVVGGGLKLKGGVKKKKKKRDSEDASSVAVAAAVATQQVPSEFSGAGSSSSSKSFLQGKTPTERRKMEIDAQRRLERSEGGKEKSHREKCAPRQPRS